jgi:hypothetical protein
METNNNSSETTANNETIVDSGFGISEDLQSGNAIPFKAGIQKGLLVSVKGYNKANKKGDKNYDVLEFKYVSLDNIATYTKIEFAVEREKDIKNGVKGGKEKAMNIRIKHIYEAYQSCPTEGLGFGATSWLDYFQRIAKAFNENKAGQPIFKIEGKYIPVWLKFTYFNNDLGFPYSPNFIETIKEGKDTNLIIDFKFDQITQIEVKKPAGMGNDPGAGVFGSPSADAYEEFLK